jgi:signal peptidase II
LIKPLEAPLKSFFRKTRWLFLIAAVIVILDQITKELVRTNIPVGESWMPWTWLAPYARIIHWTNTGVAFGMFQGNNVFFAILASVVALAIVYYYPSIPEEDKVLRFAMAMQLGGALGNLIDRIFIGQVTDFASVGNFAVFNVADSCITVGVGVLLLGVFLEERRERRLKQLIALAKENEESKETSTEWPNVAVKSLGSEAASSADESEPKSWPNI